MAEDPDKNRHPKVSFSSEEKDASTRPSHATRSIASTDLQTPGGAKLTGVERAASQPPPAQHLNSSNSTNHNPERPGKKAKGITYITVKAPPASKPVAVKPFRELESLRSRFMKSGDEDLNHTSNSRRNTDFGQYCDSSYGVPGTQAVPYNPMNNSHQSYFNGYPPPAFAGSSSRFRHAAPYYYSGAPTPTGTPKGHGESRFDEKYDEVNRLKRELQSLREGASKKGKDVDITSDEFTFRQTAQSKGKQPRDEPGESSKSREVELLMEQLNVEKTKNLLEDLKYSTFQQDLEKEFEDDYRQRLASALAEEKERMVREAEARQASQKDALAKLEADKQAQGELQQIQLNAIQGIMEKLGNQMTMMQQREVERQAEEERKKEKKELKKRQQEMKKKQREMEEQRARVEQLQREEQKQKEEQQRMQEEREREEQRRIEEQIEMEEKRREKERLQKLEQEALQKLRDDWAHQQALERKKQAEAERLRLEQEEKEKANLEAMERLRETIRAEERERIREEERKREEDQRLLQEEELRRNDSKPTAEDTRRQVEEGVQRNLSEKLRSEIERLQNDLRRRTWGAQPDFVKGITVSLPKPEVLYRSQPQLEWDPNWKFPPSNPFSKRRRHISRSQQQEPRYLEDPSQFPGFTRENLFGDAHEQPHWTYGDTQGPATYFGESGQGQRPGWQNEGYSASSTPAPLRGNSQFGDDGTYEIDGHGVYSQNPYASPQQQNRVPYQVPIAQSETSESNLDDTQSDFENSSAFLNGKSFHGMHGANQYPPEGYMSGHNRASMRTFQQASPSNNRPRAHNFNHRNVFDDVGAETNGNGQVMYASYMPGHKSDTSEGSTDEVNWTDRGDYAEINHNFERQRPRTQQKSTQPPPSVPTPPAESPLQPAHGRPSKSEPVLNANGHFPNDHGAVKGFPPTHITQQTLPAQYLRLDQGATLGVFQNVPVLMVPIISVCSVQLDQPATVPPGTSGKAAES